MKGIVKQTQKHLLESVITNGFNRTLYMIDKSDISSEESTLAQMVLCNLNMIDEKTIIAELNRILEEFIEDNYDEKQIKTIREFKTEVLCNEKN